MGVVRIQYNAQEHMTLISSIALARLGALALMTTAACSQTGPPIAHLEKRGAATQLIVDGKPFLALAGELDQHRRLQP